MIAFNKPYLPENSRRYVVEALDGSHYQGDGQFTRKCSDLLSNLVGGGKVLLTTSCTHALELASMLGNFGPGDQVILPSYTFTSAATAVTKFGATPVFVDINPETKCIDVDNAIAALNEDTVAISWVNYAGVTPDIEKLQNVAQDRNLLLIEDNAHGLGGSYKGKPLGSFGDFATQSFHATKNVQCGEGGALVINNTKFTDRAEIMREKGTDRSKFIRGEVQKYQWIDKGSSYLISDILAAILLGQIESFEDIQKSRVASWNLYRNQLEEHCSKKGIRLSTGYENHSSNIAHMFYLECPDLLYREKLILQLELLGIVATSHYQPLHSSVAGKSYPTYLKEKNYSTEFSEQIIRLPLWTYMDSRAQEKIIESILNL
jgi:dTDP-4-amino-4,6-dideoxygalactose transaminase